MLRVLIADDHALMREGIQIILERYDSECSTSEATNHRQVEQMITESDSFDLVILDLMMPGKESFSGLRDVLEIINGAPVAVLSASEDPSDMRRSIEMGAKAYIPKSVSNDVLLAAIKLVLSGGIYVPTQLINYDGNHQENLDTIKNKAAVETLTRRQTEVLGLLAQGRQNKEIGNTLGISEGTVRTHIATIFKILEAKNRTQASIRARELGIID